MGHYGETKGEEGSVSDALGAALDQVFAHHFVRLLGRDSRILETQESQVKEGTMSS